MDEGLVSWWNCPDGVVPISRQDLSCHYKTVQMAMQKPWQLERRLATLLTLCRQKGSVRVQQNLISWNEFTRIDFRGWSRSSPGCKRQLIKPTELVLVLLSWSLEIISLFHIQPAQGCLYNAQSGFGYSCPWSVETVKSIANRSNSFLDSSSDMRNWFSF